MLTRPDTPFALAFPGAGTAPSAAEVAWTDRFARRMLPPLRDASDVAGADLVAAVDPSRFQALGPLARQCFTFAFGLGVADVVRDAMGAPAAVAGHSLGVYAAAVASGALPAADGLAMLEAAYRLAVGACRGRSPAMLAIAGPADVDPATLAACGPSLRVAIRNGAFSVVVAGVAAEAERLAETVGAQPGVRLTWLDREVAYHHPGFLEDAVAALGREAAGLRWRDPDVPVVSAVDGGACRTGADVAAATATNLGHPIDWRLVVAALGGMGVGTVWECGPGDSLARIGRGCEPDLDVRTARRWARREAG